MKLHIIKLLIASVLLTLSAHTQASLIKYTASGKVSNSAFSGTFTYDNVLNTYSNVNLTYNLANGNLQTISALTGAGQNSATALSSTFVGSRPVLSQNTDFKLSFTGLGGLNALSTITWSGVTDILVAGTQRKVFGFLESGVATFSVTEVLSRPAQSAFATPLPSTIALFASGLFGFAGYRRFNSKIWVNQSYYIKATISFRNTWFFCHFLWCQILVPNLLYQAH